ncbi:MAG: DUF3106 domain-containing protein [Burkholderiaceae bacterium]|nr:DUF3106 domain-containing protein [Burkholderiaceae bacterium]
MNKVALSFSIFALLFCTLPTSAYSQEPITKLPSKETQASKQVSKLDWPNLSPLQQTVLASLESDWNTFNQNSKVKWLKVADRYPSMSSADQERLQGRMSEWSKLPQKDRRMARDNYLSSLQFPPEQKKAAWEAYQQLSEEEKQKLAQQERAQKKTGAVSSPAIQPRPVLNNTSAPSSNPTIK